MLPWKEICERVWDYVMVHGDRSVDVYVRKRRQKLESAWPGWRYIHTHFGIGYRFTPEVGDYVPSRPAAAQAAGEPVTVA